MEITTNIHETNGRSVTVALPGTNLSAADMHAAISGLHKIRKTFGHRSPAGLRCSNIEEIITNMQGATGEQLARLKASYRLQMGELIDLTRGH